MISAFLLGLAAIIGSIFLVAIFVMTIKWLKDYITKRLKSREKHKVAFADTKEIVDDYLKNKAAEADEISMEDLERMCDELPFVAADVDNETGEITGYEAIKADEVDESFKTQMKQQKGFLLFER